jgi:hypothetical protein
MELTGRVLTWSTRADRGQDRLRERERNILNEGWKILEVYREILEIFLESL